MTAPTVQQMAAEPGGAAGWLWRERGAAEPYHYRGERVYMPEADPHRHSAGEVPIAVAIIGDGRDELLHATMASFMEQVSGYCLHGVVQVDDRAHLYGFDGAIRQAWRELRSLRERGVSFRYVFHLEEDWEFTRPVDLRELAAILEHDQTLAQVALRRGPVNAYERSFGGFAEAWPGEYERLELQHGVLGWSPLSSEQWQTPYLRHRLGFTTNPSLYPARLLDGPEWPEGPGSEARYGELLKELGGAFAFYGQWGDRGLRVRHTGDDQRRGVRY